MLFDDIIYIKTLIQIKIQKYFYLRHWIWEDQKFKMSKN